MEASQQDRQIRQIDFAEMCGVTEGGISKAIKRGTISLSKNGLINLSNKKVAEFLKKHDNRRDKEYKKNNNKSKEEESPKQEDQELSNQDQQHPPEPPPPEDYNIAESNNNDLNINEENVRFWKDVEDIRQKRIKSAQMRSELVSRDLVKQVLSKMYAVDSEQWKMLPASLANSLAAAFGQTTSENVQVAEKLIDEHVHLILKRVKRIIEDAFKEMNIEGDF